MSCVSTLLLLGRPSHLLAICSPNLASCMLAVLYLLVALLTCRWLTGRDQLVEASGMAALHDTHGGQTSLLEAVPAVAELTKLYKTQSRADHAVPDHSGADGPSAELQEWLRLRSPNYSLA